MKEKIGFVTASIHQGSSSRMWQELTLANPKDSSSLYIVFPGGRLSYNQEGEYLRNSIYNYISRDNLDGAVCWTSSLTGACDKAELDHRLEQFSALPFVSIGQAIEGIPSVWFDAYGGMQNEIRHFIHVHKVKKIAFLRGPVTHKSAQERFTAYVDTLKDSNIRYDSALVSSPHDWNDGKAAIEELLDERGLIPGRSFETLIAASDYMLSAAVEVLVKRGYSIPSDLTVGGFNDNDGIYMMSVSPTTVRMPISAMVNVSLNLIKDLLDSKESPLYEINLPSPLMIRRSCGCKDSFGGEKNAKRLVKDKEAYLSWFESSWNLKMIDEEIKAYFNYLFSLENSSSFDCDQIEEKSRTFILLLLEKLCDVDFITEAFSVLCSLVLEDENLIRIVYNSILPSIAVISARFDGKLEYENEQKQLILARLKNELLQVRSFSALSNILEEYLKKLGFFQFYLVLYDNDNNILVSGSTGKEVIKEQGVFSSSLIVPKEYLDNLDFGLYVLEPLFVDSQELGHLLLESNGNSALEIEDIASAVSSAIKGIRLLEEANHAKEKAEKAERASSEFFADITEYFKEPISLLKKFSENLSFSGQGEYDKQLLKIEQLLDLALSRQDALEINKELVNSKELFSSYDGLSFLKLKYDENLPAIFVDLERIRQAVDIYIDDAKNYASIVNIRAYVVADGFILKISASSWNPGLLNRSASFLLAEKIVMLHKGRVNYDNYSVNIDLPWPSINEDDNHVFSGNDILFIKSGDEDIPSVLENAIVVSDGELISDFHFPKGIKAIALDLSVRNRNRDILLHLISNSRYASYFPLICFSLDKSYSSLSLALSLTNGKTENLAYVLGDFPRSLTSLSSYGEIHSFSTLDALLGKSDENSISLIVLNKIDAVLIKRLRSNINLSQIPILIISSFFNSDDIASVIDFPNVVLCNEGVAEAEEFMLRVIGVMCRDEILPTLTGALVKKAIAYLNDNFKSPISRWQIASSVNISEDYLTRIFHKEMGLSPTDYLNRLRIQYAAQELKLSGKSISEVAFLAGFQDQAYFCRVFKKIKGFSPSSVRKR